MPSPSSILITLCWTIASLSASAATSPTTPVASDMPSTAELKSLMCDRGKLLFSDDFTADSMVKNWGDSNLKGFSFENQAVKITAIPNEHPPMRFHSIDITDVIVQVDLKLDGVDWISLGWDSKQAPPPGHMERISVRPGSWDMHREGGLGKDRSHDSIDKMNTKIEPGKWYTLVWESHGTERLASLDQNQILYGDSDGIDIAKSSLWLEISSNPGKYAWYAHLKVWQATVKPDWDKRGKLMVLDYLKKRK